MADSTLSNLPTATGEVANDALIYIVDDLASSTATSLQTQFSAAQKVRIGRTFTGNTTLTATDAYTLMFSDVATATHTLTIPALSVTSFELGTWVHILQQDDGQMSVTSTTSATGARILSPENPTAAARRSSSMVSVTLFSTATEGTWIFTGDMATATA